MKYSKYGNKKVRVGGDVFDSKREYERWCELVLLEKAGVIQDLERQIRFQLVPVQKKPGGGKEGAVHYIADFSYWQDGVRIVEDAKGVRTKEYVIKRKLMLWQHGIEIREV